MSARANTLILVLLIAFAIRLWGREFALPQLIHSDENEYVSVAKSQIDNTPSPYKIGVPKSAFNHLLGYNYSFYRRNINNSDLIEDYFPTGRAFSALLSILGIIAWHLAMKNFFNSKIALLTTTFLSLSLIDVQIAHYIKEDVYVQFFGLLSICFLSFAYVNGRRVFLILSIISAVLAGSAKINGFLFVIPIGLYLAFFDKVTNRYSLKHLFRFNTHKILLVILILSSFGAYYISSPISFMESHSSKKYSLDAILSPEHEVLVMSSDKDGLPNYLFWPYYLFTTGLGPFFTSMSALGIWILITKRKEDALRLYPIWTIFLMYYTLLSVQTQRFDRWITLITPIFALFAAIASTWMMNAFPKRISVTFVTLGLLSTLYNVASFNRMLMREDTRITAKSHLKEMSKDNILLFLPGLDPVKHALVSDGGTIYDIQCPIDPNNFAGMYFVKNDTLFDIYARFDSSYYTDQVECVDNLVEKSILVRTIAPSSKSMFHGPSNIVGPATIHYLHSPQISVYKITKAKLSVDFFYTPKMMISKSSNMSIIDNSISSIKNTEGRINGPYIPIPAGEYEVSFDYTSIQNTILQNKSPYTVTILGEDGNTILHMNAPISSNQREQQFVANFRTSKPTKIETHISIPPESIVRFSMIRIKSRMNQNNER